MSILEKARNLPEGQRKIIFRVTLVAIALILMFFWIKSAQNKFKDFDLEKVGQQLNFPLR